MLITHCTRILRCIKPDYVHVFVDGRVLSGGRNWPISWRPEGYRRFENA